ncbi:ABC transporter ATP-binding protein [Asticcacaulis sp. DXS10W]|uniref:ABC transporter ATP-binding protein n=1 Tax=Asticcacaulis currens TaxID=2984210 RepID=A0ABT5I9C8_9CAUL|nr:ABC transporter ATP-binding protein [Asticcacaulis currens]MDC7692780.1 ABC transporter ATP-binding protein [Asticcacaulis currens]
MKFSQIISGEINLKKTLKRSLALAKYLYSTSPSEFARTSMWVVLAALSEGAAISLLYPAITHATDHPLPLPLLDGLLQRSDALPETYFLVLLSGFVVVTVIGALATRQRAICVAKLLSGTMERVRVELFQTIAQSAWPYLASRRSDDMTHLINGEIDRLQTAIGCITLTVQNAFFLIVYTLLSLFISPGISIFVVCVGVVIYLLLAPTRRQSSDFGNRLTRFKQEQYRVVGTFLSAIKTIKAYNAENTYIAGVKKSLSETYSETNAYVRRSSWSAVLYTSLAAFALCAFLLASILIFRAPVSEIGALLIIYSRLVPRFGAVQDQAQALLVNLPAFEALERLKDEAHNQAESDVRNGLLPVLSKSLSFRDVSFGYGDTPVLQKLSFDLPVGKLSVVGGPSGTGKSTLADIAMGFLRPQGGAVFIDGIRLDDAQCKIWRDQIAYVPQDTQIFNATLRENLTMGRADITDDEVHAALGLAHAADFTSTFENGLDADLSAGETGLSGGQKQRLAIARAILRQPRLYILDEPTSALDAHSTSLVLHTLSLLKSRSVVLVISHDLAVLQKADHLITLGGAFTHQ